MFKPIKKKWLPNTLDYYKWLGDSGEGDTYDTKKILDYVAFQNSIKRVATNDGYIKVSEGVLIIDAKNSKMDNNTVTSDMFNANDKVIFKDRTYRVEDVEALDCCNNEDIHHWEVTLK